MATSVTDPQVLVLSQAVKVLLIAHLESAKGQTSYSDATVAALKTSLQAIITAMGGA